MGSKIDPHADLPGTIDDMIISMYRRRGQSIVYDEEIMRDWMDENVMCHIEDAGPFHLASAFNELRERYLREDVGYPWCPARGGDLPDLPPVSGEIDLGDTAK